jgi:hypothetical protein
MFEKIIPIEKGPATWFSRNARRSLFLVFAILGRSAGVIAMVVTVFRPLREPVPLVFSVGVLIAIGSFILIGEYFREEDEA